MQLLNAGKTGDDEHEAGRRAIAYLEANFDAIADQYEEKYGAVLDADKAKECFPEYAESLESRTRLSGAFYAAAQRLIDRLYDKWVTEVSAGSVVFTSGGPGAGKSSALETLSDSLGSSISLVMDGTLSDFERSVRNIQTARDAGHSVVVFHVQRDFEESVDGVIARGLSSESGRVVSMETVARKHFYSRQTFRKLREHFSADAGVIFGARQATGKESKAIEASKVGEDLPQHLDTWIGKAYQVYNESVKKAEILGQPFPEWAKQGFSRRL